MARKNIEFLPYWILSSIYDIFLGLNQNLVIGVARGLRRTDNTAWNFAYLGDWHYRGKKWINTIACSIIWACPCNDVRAESPLAYWGCCCTLLRTDIYNFDFVHFYQVNIQLILKIRQNYFTCTHSSAFFFKLHCMTQMGVYLSAALVGDYWIG